MRKCIQMSVVLGTISRIALAGDVVGTWVAPDNRSCPLPEICLSSTGTFTCIRYVPPFRNPWQRGSPGRYTVTNGTVALIWEPETNRVRIVHSEESSAATNRIVLAWSENDDTLTWHFMATRGTKTNPVSVQTNVAYRRKESKTAPNKEPEATR